MKIKQILSTLRERSKLDYEYFHVFNNHKLTLDFELLGDKKNLIVVLIRSSFSYFKKYFEENKSESITDLFFESMILNNEEWACFVKMKIKDLFWLRLNNFYVNSEVELANFLYNNSMDLNRIYLEEMPLGKDFYGALKNMNGFGRLTFLNLDSTGLDDDKFDLLVDFLQKNNIKLEYFSLINSKITEASLNKIFTLDYFSELRILDVSGYKGEIYEEKLIKFISNNHLNEFYARGTKLTNNCISKLLDYSIHTVGIGGNEDKKLFELYKKRGKHLYFENGTNPTGTVYFKYDKNQEKYAGIDKENLILTDGKNFQTNYNLKAGVNLFLFDLRDYNAIDDIISENNFNYIYLENYRATLDDIKVFLDIIKKNEYKTYKINLISILLNDEKLSYIIDNLPKNVEFIEVNLAKVVAKEKYILKMVKNPAFIFENEELYRKIFKNYG